MDTREKAIQGIIDALTEKVSGVCVKTFYSDKNDNLSIEGRKSYGNILSIRGEMYNEEKDDELTFDGQNNYFECFIIWVEYEYSYERLCNLDTEDIVTIWNYMVNKLY